MAYDNNEKRGSKFVLSMNSLNTAMFPIFKNF